MTNRTPISLFAVLAIYLGLLAGAARAADVAGTASVQLGPWEAKTATPPGPKDITSKG